MSIKKIAEMTGVSCSTVSRVLNNPDYKCSQKGQREKIWKAAMEINYVPNEAARNLKSGVNTKKNHIYFINVLMTRMDTGQSDPFFSELLRVIESEVHKSGCIMSKVWYRSIFSDDKRCRRENIDAIIEKIADETADKNDGLIIIGKCNKDAVIKLKKKFKSVLCVNRDSSNGEVDEVICNGAKIASMAVEYLIELGHENIAYVGNCHNEARYRGYIDTLEKHGLEVDMDYIIPAKQTETDGYEAMKKIIETDRLPTGIYCANDVIAVGMIKYLNKYKKRYYMPSIIASDGIEEGQYTNPMLTTVQIPRDSMGKFAIYLLLDRLKNGHKERVSMELSCMLVKRSSCTTLSESSWCDYCI